MSYLFIYWCVFYSTYSTTRPNMNGDARQISCLVYVCMVYVTLKKAHRVWQFVSVCFFSPQTGTSTAVLRALEIPRSLRTRCQQAHHAQPADEGQRSHQGGCIKLFNQCEDMLSDVGYFVFEGLNVLCGFFSLCTLQKLEESDRRAQHTMDQLQREQRHLRRRLEQLGVERTRMDSTGSTLSSDKSDSDQGEPSHRIHHGALEPAIYLLYN